jgi:hypothetical protein
MDESETLGIAQRARLFPCRREHGGCGARPEEFCVTGRGRKSYTVHLDRLEQENDTWRSGAAQRPAARRREHDMSDITDADRRLAARARELAESTGLEGVRNAAGDRKIDTYEEAFGVAQYLLGELAAIIARLDGGGGG